MLINLSNHPNNTWKQKQIQKSIDDYSQVVDCKFPQIDPEWDIKSIKELSSEYYAKIVDILKRNYVKNEKNAVHIMGELTFVYHIVDSLKSSGITCVASTSKRIVEEKEGKKIVDFEFVKFREY